MIDLLPGVRSYLRSLAGMPDDPNEENQQDDAPPPEPTFSAPFQDEQPQGSEEEVIPGSFQPMPAERVSGSAFRGDPEPLRLTPETRNRPVAGSVDEFRWPDPPTPADSPNFRNQAVRSPEGGTDEMGAKNWVDAAPQRGYGLIGPGDQHAPDYEWSVPPGSAENWSPDQSANMSGSYQSTAGRSGGGGVRGRITQPTMGSDTTPDTPTSTYNDPTDTGTINRPLPQTTPQAPSDPTISDQNYTQVPGTPQANMGDDPGTQPISHGVVWGAGVRNLGSAAWDRVIKPAADALDAANEWVMHSPLGNLNPQAWGRELAGWDQLGRETNEDQQRLNALVARWQAGDTSVEPEIQTLTASLNARLGKGRDMRQALLEAGERNPNKTAEVMGGVAQGIAATALAPGLSAGVVRNVGAALLDPVGQGTGVALEAPGRLLEAGRGVGRALTRVEAAGSGETRTVYDIVRPDGVVATTLPDEASALATIRNAGSDATVRPRDVPLPQRPVEDATVRAEFGPRIEETPDTARGAESIERVQAARGETPYDNTQVPPNFDQQILARDDAPRNTEGLHNAVPPIPHDSAVQTSLDAIQSRAAAGAVTGGVSGLASGVETDEQGNPNGYNVQRGLTNAVIGTVGGAALTTVGTLGAARAIDSLVSRGAIDPSRLATHPATGERIKALIRLAAEGVPENEIVPIPRLAQALASVDPEAASEVQQLLAAPITAAEIKQILGADPTSLERAKNTISNFLIDAVTGGDSRLQRASETRADTATVRGLPPEGQRAPGSRRASSPGAPQLLERTNDPAIIDQVRQAADEMGVPMPDVFVQAGRHIQAQGGFDTASQEGRLVLSRGALDRLKPDELQGFIQHELGHIAEESEQALKGQQAAGLSNATPGMARRTPARRVDTPSESSNPNIRNVDRMMRGDYTSPGTDRPFGERVAAALTDRYAIHANVPKEAAERITAAGGTPPVERLADRVRENPNSIAAQRTREELAQPLQSVGKDDSWLAQVLVHQHNLDIARETEESVQRGVLSADLPEVELTADQRKRLMLAQHENKLAEAQETRLSGAVTKAQDELDAAVKERDDYLKTIGAAPGDPQTIRSEAANAAVDRVSRMRAFADMRVARAQDRVQAAQLALDRKRAARQASNESRRMERAARQGAEARAARQFSGGMDEQASLDALQDIEREIGPERYRRVMDAAQSFWDTGAKNLKQKVDEGIITQAEMDDLRRKYPHYVRTDIADYAEKGPAGPSPGGKAMGISTQGIRKISTEGTSKDRVNPIMSTIDSVYATENAVTRNRAARDLVASRDADPTTARLFPEIAPDTDAYAASRSTMVPPDYVLRNGEQKMTHWENGVARQFVIPSEYAQLLTPSPGSLLGDTATPVRTFFGVLKSMITTHNPAFSLAISPASDAIESVGSMMTSAGAAARRQPVTTMYQTGAGNTVSFTKSPHPGENALREAGASVAALPEAIYRLGQAIPQAFEGFMSNQYGPRAAELRKAGMAFDSRPSPEYRGKIPRWLAGPQDTRAAMEELKRTGGIQVNTPGDALRVLRTFATLGSERIGNRLEMVPRIAAANMEQKRGGDLLSQSIEGKDATIDFLRGGWLTRQANVPAMFLNAGTQSAAQVKRRWNKSPAAYTAALMTTVGIPAILAEAWNRSDPDRAENYANRSDYLKNTGIVIEAPVLPHGTDRMGEDVPNFVYIPIRGHAFILPLVREALGLADKQTGLINPDTSRIASPSDLEHWARIGASVLGSFSPIRGDDATAVAGGLVPVGMRDIIEQGTNTDLYSGLPIRTDRADENASSLSAGIASGVNAATGSEWRPSAVEHEVTGPLGYPGRVAAAASDLATGRWRPESHPLQDIPVLGGLINRFVRDTGGQMLQNEKHSMLTSEILQTLHDAGMTSGDMLAVPSRYQNAPLTRKEQLQWQRAYNGEVRQAAQDARDNRKWDAPETRKQAVEDAFSRAKQVAFKDAVGLSSSDIRDRIEREQYQKAQSGR